MLTLNIRSDIGAVHRALSDLHAKQMPFATALALTKLAQGVAAAESKQIDETFAKATPFAYHPRRNMLWCAGWIITSHIFIMGASWTRIP